jgi:hypothetical protein
MKLLNFKTQNLHQTETSYSFEDVQVEVFETLTATIKGNIEIEFDSEQGFVNPDGLDYFIDSSNVTIEKMYDEQDEEIGLSDSLMIELKQEIENALKSLTVENH